MNEIESLTADLDRAIESLSQAKAKLPAILASPDHTKLARVRKACGAVCELREWAEKQPDPVVEEVVLPVEPAKADLHPKMEEESEVAGLNVPEAAEKISRMTSVKKLEHIALTDKRHGVVTAANKRLEELSNQ